MGACSLNPLPAWHLEDRTSYTELVARVCSCSAKLAAKVADAYPSGTGLEYASAAELRRLGLSQTQATRLHGAFELARHVIEHVEARQLEAPLRGPEDVCNFLTAHLGHLDQEVFVVFLLDARQRVIVAKEIHVGSLAQVEVVPREVMRDAVRLRAKAVIVAHNHPSGDADPSAADIELTRRLSEAGRLVGIPILDHLVIARSSGGSMACTSLASIGLM